ncbi:MAG: competence/damage-inducible protein A [Ruminococcaceae bacterium]|nr:competence/damage-inducible protein A [Oscillospiraceae bacterium]
MKQGYRVKSAEILCVGTEILIGDIINTNAAYISTRLAEMGINQYHQEVVGDNPDRLRYYLKNALDRADCIIMSGGLGPTYDDLTKETVADLMGRELHMHERSLQRLESYFAGRKIKMTDNNRKQAMIPDGSVVFDNDCGTAPGMAVEDEERGKIVILLPGPPRELHPMMDNAVIPYLSQFTESVFFSRNINIFGMGESTVASIVDDIMQTSENPTVAPYAKDSEVRLRVTAKGSDKEACASLCDEMIERIRQTEVGACIYGVDTSLEEALVARLKEKGLKIAVAESCTGGMVSKTITDVRGSSAVFDGGVISYANEVKQQLLGVSAHTLETYGAVSEQTAMEMAEGVKKRMNADIGIALTGIAGPDGGSEEKPVGLVYIGVSGKAGTFAKELRIRNNGRDYIRVSATKNALHAAICEAERA